MNTRDFRSGLEKALALRYDDRLPAPFVAAKGRGRLAERIVSLAEEHGVPVEQRSALADALYQLEVGDFIPEELYRVVAELLVFARRVSQRGNS